MTNSQQIGFKQLVNGLHKFSQMQYNGKVNINSVTGQKWSLYFRLGRIIWAGGGTHPFRRWRRQMARYCPNLKVADISMSHRDMQLDCWDYIALKRLYTQQSVEREQVNNFVKNTILEVLFDISQESSFNSVLAENFPDNLFDQPISFVNIDVCLKTMLQSKQDWLNAGLSGFYPNSAPVINRAEELEKMVLPNVYNYLVNLINGKYTLRDLTLKMNKDEISVSRLLLPYILKGIIKLVELPDLPLKVNQSTASSKVSKDKNAKTPLIACVDDSPQVCEMMEKILISQGFRVIAITDSTKALPILMQKKPDLIFLDLIMPVASGYEICTQLRRSSIFKDAPIVIISASEGLVDRVRAEAAKVMGATDFINKPISHYKVLQMIDKYLHAQPVVSNQIHVDVSSVQLPEAITA